jgi:hypothetical protein
VDAAAMKFNTSGPAAAIAALEREIGVRIGKDVEPIEPVLNTDRADRLVRTAHENLMHNVKIQETYLFRKRNIANLQVVRDYRLGFIEDAAFEGWGWRLTGWVLPVTSVDDRLLAVKIHTEKRIVDGPKALWAPFGVYPQPKPKHSVNTLWPPPERWPSADQLWLCPGELKALALISSGMPATSPTVGESGALPKRLLDRLREVDAKEFVIAYDDDPAGRRWADANEAALATVGIKAVQVTWRAPKATEAPPPPAEADVETLEQEWTAGEQPQKEGVVYPEDLTDDDKAFIAWGDSHPWPK